MVFEGIFGVKKPVIGMVHLADLYSPQGLDYVISRALADARNLHLDGRGVDALLVENWEEKSASPFVSEETIRRMWQVTREVRDAVPIPVGVNVLHNDYIAAFKIARELGLQFVQLDVYSDKVRTNFSHTEGVQFDVVVDVADVQRQRQGCGATLLVNIHPKGYRPLEANNWDALESITESAKRAIDYGADGVVVTKKTGVVSDLQTLKSVKEFIALYRPGFPLLNGSGTTAANIADVFHYASGVIIGTSLKIGGVITENPVDPRNVEAVMTASSSTQGTKTYLNAK